MVVLRSRKMRVETLLSVMVSSSDRYQKKKLTSSFHEREPIGAPSVTSNTGLSKGQKEGGEAFHAVFMR